MKPHYITSTEFKAFVEAARDVPYQRIEGDLYPGVEVWMRRDDLLDPVISGNKAYKLLYNLAEAEELGATTLVTCGGAWSNHIHATAATGTRFGFHTIGIIRGEKPPKLSATLQDAERFGMQLKFVTREEYRRRSEPEFPSILGIDAMRAIYIPEGGANLAGAKGAQVLGKVVEETCPIRFDQLWLACGTGLTLAGVQSAVQSFPVYGLAVLKAAASIGERAHSWLVRLGAATCPHGIYGEYHCGGYAKYPGDLREFQQAFEQQAGIPLDPVYTAKLMYGLRQQVVTGCIPHGSKVLALHSGGLQGRRGFQLNNLHKK